MNDESFEFDDSCDLNFRFKIDLINDNKSKLSKRIIKIKSNRF